jgi:hypothetical protein
VREGVGADRLRNYQNLLREVRRDTLTALDKHRQVGCGKSVGARRRFGCRRSVANDALLGATSATGTTSIMRGTGRNLAADFASKPVMTMPREALRSCPCCGGPLTRIARRPTDRLISFFRPVHRYQCIVLECGWQGKLPARPNSMTTTPAGTAPLTTSTGTRLGD